MTIFAVVDTTKKADAPWAWVGLAADVVSLAVPFATGGGSVVKAVSKADDVVDLVKTADRVTDTADTVYDGVKAMSKVDIPDCFVAGTMIATEEGHLPIEDIKVGDHVWATDPETGVTDLKKVVNTFINETTAVTHVTINGEVITSTQTHPYYVVGQGWTLAGNLRAGDILVMLNGEKVVLELVQHEILETPVTTYNFEVADFHTYYVGMDNVLVHNKCTVPDAWPNVVVTPETKMPTQMKTSDAVDAWNDYLGPNQTNYNRYKGEYDPNRIFSADGTKSIRFGNHEMGELGTSRAHFHFEEWIYDASSNIVTYYNRLQRLK